MKYNSEQEVFDAVVKHAEQMTEPSYEAGRCVYRASNGNKCLVGALIEDCDYVADMDSSGYGTNVHSLANRELLPEYLVPYTEILSQCQDQHDDCADNDDINYWKSYMIRGLKCIAKDRGLQYNGDL